MSGSIKSLCVKPVNMTCFSTYCLNGVDDDGSIIAN